jgi:16S rRNA (adenine1518-N6/adenine1519-N6)-dimethyltransferase
MPSIRKELDAYSLVPRKRWGQHFLVDRNILNKVVQTGEIGKEDVVLEIGPGLGEMTLVLARQAKRVITIEIDPRLAEIVKSKTRNHPNVEVLREDILKIDFSHLLEKESSPLKVVANLPYQISTPLLFRLIESRRVFSALTLMVQKEVAQRMVAAAGQKDYGPLTIFVQMAADCAIRFFVKPSAFYPPPKVDSAVIHITWRKKPLVEAQEEEWFKRVVKGALGYRRKTLYNALKHSEIPLPEDAEGRMEGIGIDPGRRPETLTIEEFAILAKALRP